MTCEKADRRSARIERLVQQQQQVDLNENCRLLPKQWQKIQYFQVHINFLQERSHCVIINTSTYFLTIEITQSIFSYYNEIEENTNIG